MIYTKHRIYRAVALVLATVMMLALCCACAWNGDKTDYSKTENWAYYAVGEGKDADVGIAGGRDKCVIFRGGEAIRSVTPDVAEEELLKEVQEWLRKN